MPLEFLFGAALLAIVAYILFRIVGNIALGALLIMVVFLASYLLLGSFPSLGDVPIIGNFIPATGKAIAVIKDLAYDMEIISVSQSSEGNVLVTMANTGQLDISNFAAFVDGNSAEILNPIDSVKSGDVVILELDWKGDFNEVEIRSHQAETVYKNE